MTVRNDDDGPDRIEYDPVEFDPRWEVQPDFDLEDDAGGSTHVVLIAAAVVAAVVAVLAWLVMGSPPGS